MNLIDAFVRFPPGKCGKCPEVIDMQKDFEDAGYTVRFFDVKHQQQNTNVKTLIRTFGKGRRLPYPVLRIQENNKIRMIRGITSIREFHEEVTENEKSRSPY